MAKRILLIGWDGATPEIVSDLLTRGKLPNLAKLIQTGYYAPLQSTMRPESSIAWTTFATGVDPGVHGVFGFMRHLKGTYETVLNSSSFIHVPYFWETLSNAGKWVGVLNMPMTYPPRPVNGYLICGLMTPEKPPVFTYPPELGSQLLAAGYAIDAKAIQIGEDRQSYLQRMKALVQYRTQVAIDLLGKQDWDLGIVIFTELDRIQHFFWADMMPEHPLRPKHPLQDAIPEHYMELDRSLGELTTFAGPDTDFILMSDHGFGPCAKRFHVNAWLLQKGLLTLRTTSAYGSTALVNLMTSLKQNKVARHIKRFFLGQKPLLNPFKRDAFLHLIDWTRTKAWFADTGGIRINLVGREPQGTVTPGIEYDNLICEIINALKQTNDPKTGDAVFKEVYRSRDLYNGPQLEHAPDIIIEPYRGEFVNRDYWVTGWNYAELKTIFTSSFPQSGEHTNYGIIAESIKPDLPPRTIRQVSEHIMRLFDVPLNSSNQPESVHELDYSDEDQEVVKQRLRDLGYMG